jgi:hypothetical protein
MDIESSDHMDGANRWSFSQPYGPAALYGPPPYAYRDARTITTVMRFDGTRLEPYLPPGLELGTATPVE